MNFRFVDTVEAMHEAIADLRIGLARDPRLALDTEFVREKSYIPWLELVQLATSDGRIVMIDTRALDGQLAPLGQLLDDKGVLKLVHAIGQDAEILHTHLGIVLEPVFDTQIASAFIGHALQTGYGKLVQSELGINLPKGDAMSDWSRRPFARQMLEYAANDVAHLHNLHDRIAPTLKTRGRESWADEIMTQTVRSMTGIVPPDELWRKVGGGRNTLSRRELSVLRELCIWREDEARDRNKPPRTVMKDEVLIELARRAPSTTRAVLDLRSVPPGLGERRAQEIVDAVKAGKAVPPEQQPSVELSPGLDDQGAALFELLSAVIRVRSIEADLPPSMIASSETLRNLAAIRRVEAVETLLPGWRGQIAGDDLRDAIAGRLSVAWSPEQGKLVLRK
jgi:ribonuclease D